MALDTQAKRASAAGLGGFGFIIPSASLGQDDLQTISGFYGGILAAAAGGGFVQITLLTATEYIANALTAIDLLPQVLTDGDYIAQALTVEDS